MSLCGDNTESQGVSSYFTVGRMEWEGGLCACVCVSCVSCVCVCACLRVSGRMVGWFMGGLCAFGRAWVDVCLCVQ